MTEPNTTPIAPAPIPATTMQPKPHGSLGTIISLILIVAIIAIGALYAWGKNIADQNTSPAPSENTIDTRTPQPI